VDERVRGQDAHDRRHELHAEVKLADVKDSNAHIEQDIKVEPGGDRTPSPAVESRDGKGKATSIYSTGKGCFVPNPRWT
jgi:hypothetical protein